MKGISKTGAQIGLVVVLALSLVLGTGIPAAKASEGDQVDVHFNTWQVHWTDADSVPTGASFTETVKTTGSGLHNPPYESNEPIYAPINLTFDTGLHVDSVSPQDLVSGPPSPYVWQLLEDILQGQGQTRVARIITDPYDFTPDFSASRTFDTTVFTSSGNQTLTLTVAPQEAMDELRISVTTMPGDGVNATITSPTGGEGINLSPDKQRLDINIPNPTGEITQIVTIQVELDPNIVSVNYKPRVFINAANIVNESPPAVTNTVSRAPGGLGTWTWDTPDVYSIGWWEWLRKGVMFNELREVVTVNRVNVSTSTHYTYRATGDSVSNITTQSSPWISTDLSNRGDSTHAIVDDPILEFSTTETVTNVHPEEYLVSTDPYRWEFPDIVENASRHGGADIEGTVEFSTGFSASRSVDQTVLPAAGGNQMLIITATPLEEMDRLEMHGETDFGEIQGIATVTSVSGENANYDERRFHGRVDNPVVDTTYQWIVNIEVSPLPEGVSALEYMPRVTVRNSSIVNSDSYVGSSVSTDAWNLNQDTVLGTYTWQATGDYVWWWEERINRAVDWDGLARYIYPPPTQTEIDQAIENGMAWVRTQQDLDPSSEGYGAWYWGRPARGENQPAEEERPNVGMTGFAVWSLLHGLVPQTDPQVQAGIDYILSRQDLNTNSFSYGSFGDRGKVYETGLAILALRATNNPIYLGEIGLAADYLVRAQNNEAKVFPQYPDIIITPDTLAYGGWDYGYNSVHTETNIGGISYPWDPYVRADMSNSQFAIIGLKVAEEAGVSIDPAVWARAEIFISRCQNTDGGFTYAPIGDPQSGGSSGTITAGAVWGLRLIGISAGDPRVQGGLDWLDSHPFDGHNPAGAYRNWFLWSAAKSFTLSDRPPLLEAGNWYSDYAGYLIDNQELDGKWVNPDWPDGESNLNATTCGLLVLEKAVLPPPPGIDSVAIDHMKILFDRSPNNDKIEIKARFQLADGASYDLAEDDVIVTIGGVVIFIPAGSFAGSAGKYEYKSADGVNMKLNFNEGTWSLKVGHIDASAIDSSDGVPVVGVDVTLMIGYMLAGQNVPTWCNDLVYP